MILTTPLVQHLARLSAQEVLLFGLANWVS